MMRLPPLAVLVLPLVAAADAPAISVTDAWSRATPPSAPAAAAYLTITDTGAADALTGASSPVAGTARLHETHDIGGMTGMAAIPRLEIPAKGTVKLAPGGYHIMLEALKQPLKAGDSFPLTLDFEHAGAITVTVKVQPLSEAKPDDMGGMDMGHH